MWQYALKRLLLVGPTLLGIIFVCFVVLQFVPGGPVEQTLSKFQNRQTGETAEAKGSGMDRFKDNSFEQEQIDHLKKMYGFDQPVYVQFWRWLKRLFTFDFGDSYFRQEKVTSIIAEKFPVSLSLGVASFFLVYLICIPLGIAKAVRQGTVFDSASAVIILVAYSIPGLVMAVFLIVVFGGGSFLAIFPLRGLTSDDFDMMTTGQKVLDYLWHLCLPLIAYMINAFAVLTLQTRNLFLEQMNQQYVRTARAKGVAEKLVLWKHVFRNAMILIIAGVPAHFLAMFFSGSLFIETVFSLDGIGLLSYESIIRRDYPIVMAMLFIMSLIGLLSKIVADITLVVVDPRISFDKAPG